MKEVQEWRRLALLSHGYDVGYFEQLLAVKEQLETLDRDELPDLHVTHILELIEAKKEEE